MSFVVACGSVGGGQEARWWPLQCVFFFHVKTPVTASSPSLFFCFLSHLFFLSIPLVFFAFSPLFFFLSLLFFFFSPSPPFLLSLPLYLQTKTWGKKPTSLVQSWHSGKVVGAYTVQPPQDCLRGTSPLFFTLWQPRVKAQASGGSLSASL